MCVYDVQIAMQDIVTTNVDSLFIPESSMQLLPTTPIVASGGGGRVYRVELRADVVLPPPQMADHASLPALRRALRVII